MALSESEWLSFCCVRMLSLAAGSVLTFPFVFGILTLSLGDPQLKEQHDRAIAAVSPTEMSGMITKSS
jgi:hypothetical protein